MAEWLRRGLQILARRFDSGSGLQYIMTFPRFPLKLRVARALADSGADAPLAQKVHEAFHRMR